MLHGTEDNPPPVRVVNANGASPYLLVCEHASRHIPQRFAAEVNAFCAEHLNPYVNFHRPCLFAEEYLDTKGKTRKRYPLDAVMTPLEKLTSLPNASDFLKPGVTLDALREKSRAMSDNEAVERLNTARNRLFQSLSKRSRNAA